MPGCLPRSLSSLRSEEHTSELQSPDNIVCRLLLETRKNTPTWTRERPGKPTPASQSMALRKPSPSQFQFSTARINVFFFYTPDNPHASTFSPRRPPPG